MKRVQRKSLLFALAIAVSVIGLMLYYFQIKSLNVSPMTKIVIAATDIPEKTLISEKQLSEMLVPEKFVVQGSIRDMKQVIGKISRDTIYEGEQVLNQHLVTRSQDGLGAIVPAGYRAVTIQVTPVIGVGGNIRPEDFVDILVYLEPPLNEKERVQTIFQNVKVLDVSGQNKEFLTFCMSLEDSQKLFFIEQTGKIKLVLREMLDRKEIQTLGVGLENVQ